MKTGIYEAEGKCNFCSTNAVCRSENVDLCLCHAAWMFDKTEEETILLLEENGITISKLTEMTS